MLIVPFLKKSITITNVFQKILDETGCKPNKEWVDKANQFYNWSKKSWLQDGDLEMFWTQKEGKPVVAEYVIRTLKNLQMHDFNIKKRVYW